MTVSRMGNPPGKVNVIEDAPLLKTAVDNYLEQIVNIEFVTVQTRI